MATENMLLTLPTPLPSTSATPGPLFAGETTEAFLKVDSHNHQIRRGTLVPSAGISINADLPFNQFNVTGLRSLRFQQQVAALGAADDLNCLYSVAGNMWFNDGNGAQIQITVGNALDTSSIGSIGGDYVGSDASVYYTSASKKFFFTSDTNIAGKMDQGATTIRAVGASAKGVTLTAPAALAANYNLTFPDALPVTTKIARLSSAGVIADALDTDNSTLEVSSNNIQAKDLGITTAKIVNAAVTDAKISGLNYAVSSASGTYTNATTTFTQICTLTITTNGRTVRLMTQPASASDSYIGGNTFPELQIQRDGTALTSFRTDAPSASQPAATFQCSGSSLVDYYDITPAAGSHTYTLHGKCLSSSKTITVVNLVFVAIESDT